MPYRCPTRSVHCGALWGVVKIGFEGSHQYSGCGGSVSAWIHLKPSSAYSGLDGLANTVQLWKINVPPACTYWVSLPSVLSGGNQLSSAKMTRSHVPDSRSLSKPWKSAS